MHPRWRTDVPVAGGRSGAATGRARAADQPLRRAFGEHEPAIRPPRDGPSVGVQRRRDEEDDRSVVVRRFPADFGPAAEFVEDERPIVRRQRNGHRFGMHRSGWWPLASVHVRAVDVTSFRPPRRSYCGRPIGNFRVPVHRRNRRRVVHRGVDHLPLSPSHRDRHVVRRHARILLAQRHQRAVREVDQQSTAKPLPCVLACWFECVS